MHVKGVSVGCCGVKGRASKSCKSQKGAGLENSADLQSVRLKWNPLLLWTVAEMISVIMALHTPSGPGGDRGGGAFKGTVIVLG
ncbi:unnamed protein product [Merluccius merluccius]